MDTVSHVTDHVFFLFMATGMFSLTHTFFFFFKPKEKLVCQHWKMRFLTSVFGFPAFTEKSDLAVLDHVSPWQPWDPVK